MQDSLKFGACAGRYVYDGELEGQMTFLTDVNKRLIKVSDIYPEDLQLSKGDYIIRAQLRHDDTGSPVQRITEGICMAILKLN